MHTYSAIYINESNRWLRPSQRSKFISSSSIWACSNIKQAPCMHPNIQPSGQYVLLQIQTICGGEMCFSGLSVILSPIHGPNTKNSTHDAPFPFSVEPIPSRSVSCCSGTFLARALFFKTRWCPPHLAMAPSHLHIVYPPRTTKESPANHLLSALIPTPCVCADPPPS